MSIHGVNPKCYILALFVRDDGTRFLLGDDPFEFKDNQLHFQPNTMANDVVEVQGNDGYLLAGQVRRPGTQMFDGYVCNGTNSKEEVEVKRRAFLQFFRRSHFYKVIYIFPNGTAIQRKQGFLVDDPTVQELYQQYPEYHVALNFEDVNYYTYEEDDQGHEIYAKEAIVPLAGGGATGGLIWDSYGVVWEDQWSLPLSISGVQFQILNNAGARAPIENVELLGDTYQQTYTGANFYNYNDTASVSPSGVSVDSDGWITLEKDNTGSSTQYVNYFSNILAVQPNTDYLIVVEIKDFTVGNSGTLSIAGTSNYEQFKADRSLNIEFSTMQKGASTYIRKSVADFTNVTYGLRTTLVIPGNANINVTFRLSVIADTSITPETFVYQPYTGGIPAPNPDYPQAVQVVTGEQTVTIGDGVDSEDFTISLGSTELCKIGDYQDYIYKSGDDWYVHKETGKVTYNGSETWIVSNNSRYAIAKPSGWDTWGSNISTYPSKGYSMHLSPGDSGTVDNSFNVGGTNVFIRAPGKGTGLSNTATWKTWLTSNNLTIYSILATPTDTKITDATLVGQLEALDATRLYIGENNVLVSTPTPNLPATLAFDYYTKFAAIGAEWEEGGTKGATIVNVDAIDNTYPVWELTGPATNPTLSVLTTNTTLTYNGTITASQTLVIDMFNKTATLNGTSVIGNISGDFVYMAPGTNRLAYTAGNTDAPDSTIYWQEVVG